MGHPFFNNSNTYSTDPLMPRAFFDKFWFNSRYYFYYKYLSLIFNNRKDALKGIYDTKLWASSSFDIMKLIEHCGGRYEITGLENIDLVKEPVVFISNHMSTLETMVFPCLIAPLREVTFVVKDSIVEHPIFAPIMIARSPIVVSRKNSREDLMKVITEGSKVLKTGTSIVIFPQSTRTVNFDRNEFNSLGTKLAAKNNVKVIPVAIKTDFWGNGKWIKEMGKIDRKKKIYIKFGKPIEVTATGKEANNEVIEFIESNLKIWNQPNGQ